MCHFCKSRPYGEKREFVVEYSAKKIFRKKIIVVSSFFIFILVSKHHLGWTLFLYVILLCVREDNLGEKQEKEGRRVNLKQTNTRGKVIVVFHSFHFCRWSVWSSMNENLLAATHVLGIEHNLGALYFNVSFY